MKIIISCLNILIFCKIAIAHPYWQQSVDYQIKVNFDASTHQYDGDQILVYSNNSPDTLFNIYYHLYFNAFQPNSMMDVRSRTIKDPDPRVMDRIHQLSPDQTGYLQVNSLSQDGTPLTYEVSETVLEVKLAKPILPGQNSTFTLGFKGQVPIQIRRSGRDSYEGIDYSMSQWFPKMAEYDEKGWHTHPYVAREFYAPWGNFDVSITIDKNYVVAATGVLQNPNEIGYGYEDAGVKVKKKGKTLTYHFKAENVHDFVWAADRDYIQTKAQVPGGPLLRFFYQPGPDTEQWKNLPELTVKAFQYMNEHFGKYGWSQYSIIQGGDGGMEYPMATLIANKRENSGVRSLRSLVGVTVHEALHSWYQGMLATNESYYAWMDEGFTSFAESYTTNHVLDLKKKDPMSGNYQRYIDWVKSGLEEPLSTHADHFELNSAYSMASYIKGAISLEQLSYLIGQKNRDQGLLNYFNQWSFKHPDMNDFIRVMEKQSKIELDWYYEYWINSTATIDYAIKGISKSSKGSKIDLIRLGRMPMPIDVLITKKDGSKMIYYIPLGIMRGEKPNESGLERITGSDWFWTHPEYSFEINIPVDDINEVEIDPSGLMADVNRANNILKPADMTPVKSKTSKE